VRLTGADRPTWPLARHQLLRPTASPAPAVEASAHSGRLGRPV